MVLPLRAYAPVVARINIQIAMYANSSQPRVIAITANVAGVCCSADCSNRRFAMYPKNRASGNNPTTLRMKATIAKRFVEWRVESDILREIEGGARIPCLRG